MEWDGLWQEGVQLDMPGYLDEGYNGQGFEASAETFSDPRRASWEEEQTKKPAPTDSEAAMAAALLIEIRAILELRHCVSEALLRQFEASQTAPQGMVVAWIRCTGLFVAQAGIRFDGRAGAAESASCHG